MNNSSDIYAVMGNPIKHSKSPQIHTAFARQTHQQLEYKAILVPQGGFDDAVKKFRQQGGKGLNITVPFKLDAWQYCQIKSQHAELAGAVNTLILADDGDVRGENTDGIGLVNDLKKNLKISIAAKKILLLGAGGASRGVIGPILAEQPQCLTIANRTVEKARQLAKIFNPYGQIEGCGLNDVNGVFDIIINATSASLEQQVPPVSPTVIYETTCCYDMMYSAEPTAFVRWSQQHQAALAVDGLGMLVEQAAQSFWLWRGIKPDTQSVIKLLSA